MEDRENATNSMWYKISKFRITWKAGVIAGVLLFAGGKLLAAMAVSAEAVANGNAAANIGGFVLIIALLAGFVSGIKRLFSTKKSEAAIS